MNVLLEIVAEFVIGLFGGLIGKEEEDERVIPIESMEATLQQDSYLAGLLATAMVVSIDDDKKFDQDVEKIIKSILKKDEKILSNKARKNIKLLKHFNLTLDNLKLIYLKLNIDEVTILKITNDLEHILKYAKKDTQERLEIINKIRDIKFD